MFKPKGLLKVISVILIIFGVLGLLGMLLLYFMGPQLIEMGLGSLLEEALSPLSIIISIVSSFSYIMAGVFGISGKSLKGAMIFGGIYTLFEVYSIITSVMVSFSPLIIVNLILPILFWWGIYQSKEG